MGVGYEHCTAAVLWKIMDKSNSSGDKIPIPSLRALFLKVID
jgi:hypothetical protein